MGNRIGVSKNWLTTFLGIHNYIRVITKVLQNAWKHKNTHTHIHIHMHVFPSSHTQKQTNKDMPLMKMPDLRCVQNRKHRRTFANDFKHFPLNEHKQANVYEHRQTVWRGSSPQTLRLRDIRCHGIKLNYIEIIYSFPTQKAIDKTFHIAYLHPYFNCCLLYPKMRFERYIAVSGYNFGDVALYSWIFRTGCLQ